MYNCRMWGSSIKITIDIEIIRVGREEKVWKEAVLGLVFLFLLWNEWDGDYVVGYCNHLSMYGFRFCHFPTRLYMSFELWCQESQIRWF